VGCRGFDHRLDKVLSNICTIAKMVLLYQKSCTEDLMGTDCTATSCSGGYTIRYLPCSPLTDLTGKGEDIHNDISIIKGKGQPCFSEVVQGSEGGETFAIRCTSLAAAGREGRQTW